MAPATFIHFRDLHQSIVCFEVCSKLSTFSTYLTRRPPPLFYWQPPSVASCRGWNKLLPSKGGFIFRYQHVLF